MSGRTIDVVPVSAEALRAEWRTRMPEPIAELMASIDAARSRMRRTSTRGRCFGRTARLVVTAGVSITVLLVLPQSAEAGEDCLKGEVGPGFFIALPRCRYTVLGELSVTAGTAIPAEDNQAAVARVAGEAGVLFATAGPGSVEIGPVLSVAALSDVSTGRFAPEVAPLLRARYWIADDSSTLEGAVGPTMRFLPDQRGLGSLVSVGLGIKGVGGPQLLYDNMLWPESEHRIQAGFWMTWGAVLVFAALAADDLRAESQRQKHPAYGCPCRALVTTRPNPRRTEVGGLLIVGRVHKAWRFHGLTWDSSYLTLLVA